MGDVIYAAPLFAERTAAMCIKEWDHTEIKIRMALFPKLYEKLVALSVEDQIRDMRDNGELDDE